MSHKLIVRPDARCNATDATQPPERMAALKAAMGSMTLLPTPLPRTRPTAMARPQGDRLQHLPLAQRVQSNPRYRVDAILRPRPAHRFIAVVQAA